MVFVKDQLRIIVIVAGELGRPLASGLRASKWPFCRLARTLVLELGSAAALLVHADCQIAKDAVVDAHAAFEFRNLFARALKLQIDKRAFSFVQNLVGQLAATERFSFSDGAALVGDDLLAGLSNLIHFILVRVRIDDEENLVLS